MTGITSIAGSLAPKRLELMREFLRDDAPIGILINPANPHSGAERQPAASGSGSKCSPRAIRPRSNRRLPRLSNAGSVSS